jgi:hypothetical protein
MILSHDLEWRRVPGASVNDLDRLRRASPVQLPEEYLALLAESDGGEGPLPVQPLWFQLDPAKVTASAIEGGAHEEFFRGFVVIGSNGGGEFVALDVRASPPWQVVAIDMTNIDLVESVRAIAPEFASFLQFLGRRGN